MEIKRYPLGALWTNCYVVTDSEGVCFVVDPGGDPKELLADLEAKNTTIDCVLLTHGHCDHIMGSDQVREKAKKGLGIHKGDQDCLTNGRSNLSDHFGDPLSFQPADFFISDGQDISIGKMNVRVIHTPGHTAGGCCFLVTEGEDKLLLSGDTLFARSIGRSDFPGGDEDVLIDSLRKLAKLADDTPVYPGHGPSTTIGDERTHNPFWPR